MDGEADQLKDELRIRWFGVPAALLVALAFHSFALGQFLQRTFFGMWLHDYCSRKRDEAPRMSA